MATFCDISGCNNLSFRTDKNTRKHYCSNHWRQYSTDIDKRGITAKALSRGKDENKISKEPRFQSPKKIHKGTFDESVLNTKIDFVKPTPESFDGLKVNPCRIDEMPKWETHGIDESLVNLGNDLDYVLSQYIRYKYADKNGMVKCFTCPAILPIKEIQNGHYVKRSNKATRYLEANCRPQCPTCNQDHNYDETPYTNALEAEQPGLAAQLKEICKMTYKATRDELKQQLIELRSRLEILKF